MSNSKISKAEIKAQIEKKLLSMLGFAAKAGKIISGVDRICDEVRRHGMPSEDGQGLSSCGIVLLSCNASENTVKRVTNACKYYRVELVRTTLTTDGMASIIGKASSAACATFDRSFSDGIRKALSLNGTLPYYSVN